MARLRSRIFGASGMARAGMLTMPSPSSVFFRGGRYQPTARDRRIAVGPGDGHEVVGVDLQQREVVLGLGFDHGCRQFAGADPAGQLAVELAGLGDDVSVFADHRSQGGRLGRRRAPRPCCGRPARRWGRCRGEVPGSICRNPAAEARPLPGMAPSRSWRFLAFSGVRKLQRPLPSDSASSSFRGAWRIDRTDLVAGSLAWRGLGRFGLVRAVAGFAAGFSAAGSLDFGFEASAASAFFSHWSISWCICSGVTIIVPFLIRRNTSGSPARSRSWKSRWNLRKSSGLVAALPAGAQAAALPAGGDFSHLAISRSMSAGVDVEVAVLHQIADFRIAGHQPLKEQLAEPLELCRVGHVAGVQVGGSCRSPCRPEGRSIVRGRHRSARAGSG